MLLFLRGFHSVSVPYSWARNLWVQLSRWKPIAKQGERLFVGNYKIIVYAFFFHDKTNYFIAVIRSASWLPSLHFYIVWLSWMKENYFIWGGRFKIFFFWRFHVLKKKKKNLPNELLKELKPCTILYKTNFCWVNLLLFIRCFQVENYYLSKTSDFISVSFFKILLPENVFLSCPQPLFSLFWAFPYNTRMN